MATAKKAPTSRQPAGTRSASVKKAALKKPAAAPAAPATGTKSISKTVRAKKPAAPPPAQAAQTDKIAKTRKPKLVRDSFTIPKAEYVVLDDLKQRATALARPVKKSELLRAGIKALAALGDNAFLAALDQVPAIKTGRPAA